MRKSLLAGAAALAAAVAAAPPAVGADMDGAVWTMVDLENLEYRVGDDDDVLAWDGRFRIGTDENRLLFKTEGEYLLEDDGFETVETQLLYQRMVGEFFDVHVGVRHDVEPDPSRTYAVLGVEGLAPQWFEVDASLFLSDEGGLFARIEAEQDFLLTQKLVLQPKAEVDIAFSDDPAIHVGSGVSSLEAGLRLRYEVVREFAPYVGVHWERSFGETADLLRGHGENPEALYFVGGVRAFF